MRIRIRILPFNLERIRIRNTVHSNRYLRYSIPGSFLFLSVYDTFVDQKQRHVKSALFVFTWMMHPRWFHNYNKAGKNNTRLFKTCLSCIHSTVINSFVFYCQLKKGFKKECTGACLRGFCEEPDPPSRTRYTTVHHVPPLVEHAGHDLPHPPACIASFAGMKLHFLRHASPNLPECIPKSPAFVFAVANVRVHQNASSHSLTSIPASGNVHRRIRRHVWIRPGSAEHCCLRQQG
jgi:hypothetical protein